MAILACAALPGCSGVLSAIGGGLVPDVAANVQAGRTNAQTIGQTVVTDQRIVKPTTRTIEQSTGETGIRTERVERIEVRHAPPAWLIVALVVGWLAPSPAEIVRRLTSIGRRRA